MGNGNRDSTTYVYNYAYGEEESSLCALEMRAFFGKDSTANIVESTLKVDPSRSPFLRGRLDVIYEGNRVEDIVRQVEALPALKSTFKVTFIQSSKIAASEKVAFRQRLKIEREVGYHISGRADLGNPDLVFGIMFMNGRWIFGIYHENGAVWLRHKTKPHSYSTALNTRVARAVVNIAVPNPTGVKAIDPCCGIGTVLIEALSMDIDMVGSDNNPLILSGVRENIAHFGLTGEVTLKDMRDVTGSYDVAIIDLPYNLCSVITPEEQLEMLQSAREFAAKLVIVTVESIDPIIENAGFQIVDRCELKKRKFIRQVLVCK